MQKATKEDREAEELAEALAEKADKANVAKPSDRYRYFDRLTMSAEEWFAVQDNPRQRDTEDRLPRAKHLRESEDCHRLVVMATTPDNQWYKIDGHTRAAKWIKEGCPFESIIVDVYECEDEDAVADLYLRFDNPVTMETARDRVQGGLHQAGIQLETNFLRGGRFSTPLKEGYSYLIHCRDQNLSNNERGGTVDWRRDERFTYLATNYFKSALLKIDRLNPDNNRFRSGIMMAALWSFMHPRIDPAPFWQAYVMDRGEKTAAGMDAVFALTDIVKKAKTHTGDDRYHQASCALAAIERWRTGDVPYLAGLRALQPHTVRHFLKQLPPHRYPFPAKK